MSDASFVSWFLGGSSEPRPLGAAPDPAAAAAPAPGAGADPRMSQSVSIASLMSQAGRARPKSSSELMLEDAVRWVLWQYARGALRVDNDARALMTLPKMTLGSQQWLIQFIAGRRLSQSQAAQLWAKHDPAQRGWIDALSLRSLMNDVMHTVYKRRMVTEEMFQLIFNILNSHQTGQILREHFLTLYVDHLLPFVPLEPEITQEHVIEALDRFNAALKKAGPSKLAAPAAPAAPNVEPTLPRKVTPPTSASLAPAPQKIAPPTSTAPAAVAASSTASVPPKVEPPQLAVPVSQKGTPPQVAASVSVAPAAPAAPAAPVVHAPKSQPDTPIPHQSSASSNAPPQSKSDQKPKVAVDRMVDLMARLRVAAMLFPRLHRRARMRGAFLTWSDFVRAARWAGRPRARSLSDSAAATDVLATLLQEQSDSKPHVHWSGLSQEVPADVGSAGTSAGLNSDMSSDDDSSLLSANVSESSSPRGRHSIPLPLHFLRFRKEPDLDCPPSPEPPAKQLPPLHPSQLPVTEPQSPQQPQSVVAPVQPSLAKAFVGSPETKQRSLLPPAYHLTGQDSLKNLNNPPPAYTSHIETDINIDRFRALPSSEVDSEPASPSPARKAPVVRSADAPADVNPHSTLHRQGTPIVLPAALHVPTGVLHNDSPHPFVSKGVAKPTSPVVQPCDSNSNFASALSKASALPVPLSLTPTSAAGAVSGESSAALAALRTELETRESELRSVRSSVATLSASHEKSTASYQERLEAKDIELNRLRASVSALSESQEKLQSSSQATLTAKESELQKLQSSVSELTATNQKLRASSESQIAALESQSRGLAEQLQQQHNAAAQQQQYFQQQLEQQRNSLQTLHQQHADEVARLQVEFTRQEEAQMSVSSAYEQRIANLEAQLQQAIKERSTVFESSDEKLKAAIAAADTARAETEATLGVMRKQGEQMSQQQQVLAQQQQQLAQANTLARSLADARAALTAQSELSQSLAQEVQLLRDKCARMSTQQDGEAAQRISQSEEANRSLQNDLRTQRLALAKYRLGVFVQRTCVRLQLSALFRWRQMTFLKHVAFAVDAFIADSRVEKDMMLKSAQSQLAAIASQRDLARRQALRAGLLSTKRRTMLRNALKQWCGAAGIARGPASSSATVKAPPFIEQQLPKSIQAHTLPILSHSIAVLNALLQQMRRSVSGLSPSDQPPMTTQQLALQHTCAALSSLHAQLSALPTSSGVPRLNLPAHQVDDDLLSSDGQRHSVRQPSKLYEVRQQTASPEVFAEVARAAHQRTAFSPSSSLKVASPLKRQRSMPAVPPFVELPASALSADGTVVPPFVSISHPMDSGRSSSAVMHNVVEPEAVRLTADAHDIRRMTDEALSLLSPPKFIYKSSHQAVKSTGYGVADAALLRASAAAAGAVHSSDYVTQSTAAAAHDALSASSSQSLLSSSDVHHRISRSRPAQQLRASVAAAIKQYQEVDPSDSESMHRSTMTASNASLGTRTMSMSASVSSVSSIVRSVNESVQFQRSVSTGSQKQRSKSTQRHDSGAKVSGTVISSNVGSSLQHKALHPNYQRPASSSTAQRALMSPPPDSATSHPITYDRSADAAPFKRSVSAPRTPVHSGIAPQAMAKLMSPAVSKVRTKKTSQSSKPAVEPTQSNKSKATASQGVNRGPATKSQPQQRELFNAASLLGERAPSNAYGSYFQSQPVAVSGLPYDMVPQLMTVSSSASLLEQMHQELNVIERLATPPPMPSRPMSSIDPSMANDSISAGLRPSTSAPALHSPSPVANQSAFAPATSTLSMSVLGASSSVASLPPPALVSQPQPQVQSVPSASNNASSASSKAPVVPPLFSKSNALAEMERKMKEDLNMMDEDSFDESFDDSFDSDDDLNSSIASAPTSAVDTSLLNAMSLMR